MEGGITSSTTSTPSSLPLSPSVAVIAETTPTLTNINNTPNSNSTNGLNSSNGCNNNNNNNNNNSIAIVSLNNTPNSGNFRTDSFGDQELDEEEIPEVQEIEQPEGSKWDDWRWHKNGQSVLKENGHIRQHYCCQKRKFGCPAKLVIDSLDNNAQIVHPPIGKHNHSPPEKPREKIQYLQPPRITPKNQALGEKIQNELAESPSFKMAPLHTKSPRVMKSKETKENTTPRVEYIKKSKLPSSDALQNILTQHGKSFLMKLTLYPEVKIILSSQSGLDILTDYGNEVCIGGTFSVCEGSLFLSTLLVWYKEVVYPVCWFISDSKTSDTYHKFLQYVVKRTKGRWNPSLIFVDFEEPFRDAIQKTFFGKTTIANTGFHFVQSHVAWMNANGGSNLVKEMIPSLHQVWSSPDSFEFEKRKTEYLHKMQNLHPQYVKYFNNIWLQLFKPVNWAYFGRVNTQFASVGHALEGWYNRSKSNMIDHQSESVDHLVNTLWDEWVYYEFMWNETERGLSKSSRSANDITEASSPSLKRFRSSDGVINNNNNNNSSNNNNNNVPLAHPILVSSTSHSSSSSSSSPPLSNINQIISAPSDLNLNGIQATIPSSLLTPPTISSIDFMDHDCYPNPLSDSTNNNNNSGANSTVTSPSSSSNSLTPALFRSKSSKNCACGKTSNGCGKCISCCGNEETSCNVPSHMAKKNEKFQVPLLDKLSQMMNTPATNNNIPDLFWIKYIHDSQPAEIFEVKPTKWKNRHISFFGICQRDGTEKKFFVHRIKEFSDHAL